MTGQPKDQFVKEENQRIVAKILRMPADNRQSLVQRDESLTVSTSLSIVRTKEFTDERTNQLRSFFRTWISVDGAIKSCGIPTNVHITKVTVGTSTFAHRSEEGIVAHTGEDIPSTDEARLVEQIPALRTVVLALTNGDESPAAVASAVEFVLEGLHLSKRLNKDGSATGATYRSRS